MNIHKLRKRSFLCALLLFTSYSLMCVNPRLKFKNDLYQWKEMPQKYSINVPPQNNKGILDNFLTIRNNLFAYDEYEEWESNNGKPDFFSTVTLKNFAIKYLIERGICLAHEGGHAAAALCYGIPIEKIYVSPMIFGDAFTTLKLSDSVTLTKYLTVCLGGPLASVLASYGIYKFTKKYKDRFTPPIVTAALTMSFSCGLGHMSGFCPGLSSDGTKIKLCLEALYKKS